MKAILLIIIVGGSHRVEAIEIPLSSYEHCMSIAEQTGKTIAEELSHYVYSVATECIDQGE
ncbi:hypothetical protein HYP99_gp009 [Sinorhizobium phage ort11]|uniref:Uncharacterized protein n=1 Tax=Sinorhizobium phage ort11 TaxID=2599764 RepID=A0A5C2H183_9CAUD|nr:hypothetical protein HYP99_gp009 [Sinorhizobium phage ort11]QEP29807.1 hypothetical protein Smphiort11_009 [Sinorhizobium phage ort11]